MNSPKLILASESPRRQQFFHALGIPFLAESADIDESPAPNETPTELVERLACAKALTVGRRLTATPADDAKSTPLADILVVGADTVVAVQGEVLGKPVDADGATAMLSTLRARPHQVHTALAVALFVCGKFKRTCSLINTTTVNMRSYIDAEISAYVATGDPLDKGSYIDAEISAYVATGDPLDKAGAYAIQHQQFSPVESFSGCPAGVMGLPAADLLRLLSEFNFIVNRSPSQVCPALTGFQCCQERAAQTQCLPAVTN